MSPKKTALLTGITGFIGSRLARHLMKEGWRVHGVIPATESQDAALTLFHECSTPPTFHAHDGSTEGMQAIVSESKPNLCFHLASLFLAKHAPKDIAPLVTSNILFGTQLAEALVHNQCFQLINVGSAWQHFESRPYSPIALYAATKQAYMDMLRYYADNHGLCVLTLKFFDTYGPGDSRPKLLNLLKRTALAGTPLPTTEGEQLIDLVHIDDVLSAFVCAANHLQQSNNAWQEFAVSSGKPLSIRSLVRLYEEATASHILAQWGAIPYRGKEMFQPWLAGQPVPGWHPQVELQDGIRSFHHHSSS